MSKTIIKDFGWLRIWVTNIYIGNAVLLKQYSFFLKSNYEDNSNAL